MNDLEQRIREHYESEDVPAETLAGIRAEGLAAYAGTKRRRRNWIASLSAAAAIVAGIFLAMAATNPGSPDLVNSAIAAQVAVNHNKHEPGAYTYESADFKVLESKLEKLNFSLAAVEPAVRDRFDLAGCSYCSVAGNVAVHFNATERETGRTGSLYVTALGESLDGFEPGSFDSSGTEVEMWEDGERFFAFAASPSL